MNSVMVTPACTNFRGSSWWEICNK